MGKFGASLYDDDVALDVKDIFESQFENGEDPVKIAEYLINENMFLIETDPEDEGAVFWMALADTLHNHGLGDKTILKYAFDSISANLELWKKKYPDQIVKRYRALKNLDAKLNTPPEKPGEKKKRKPFRCQWEYGDVFAYPLVSEYAREKGLFGRFLIFHKIDEGENGKAVSPIVRVKITEGFELPESEEELNKLEYIQIRSMCYEDRFLPISGTKDFAEQIKEKSKIKYERDEYGYLPIYRLMLDIRLKRMIPKNLIYLGNYPNLTPPPKEYYNKKQPVSCTHWKWFDECVINKYFNYNKRQSSIYVTKPKPLIYALYFMEGMIPPDDEEF